MLKRWIFATVAVGLLLFAGQAQAAILLAKGDGGPSNYYSYGDTDWDNFTAALDAATSNGVTVVSDFTDLSQMLSYDALLLEQRWTSGTLSDLEVDNLGTFIGTGRRVLMFGENDAWASWNARILGIVGGSYNDQFGGLANAVVANEITASASTTYIPGGGKAIGGTALYDQNFATLWGDPANVLTILDINVVSDDFWANANNGQFATNVANWLAAPTGPIAPEPSTFVIWSLLGVVGIAFGRRRRRGA